MNDEQFMDLALQLSEEALARGDWPVAALIVQDGRVIATGQNRQNSRNDPTVHAEMDAIRSAFAQGVDPRGATIYTPMEPCPMCAAAIRLSGIEKVVIGARHADLHRTDLGSYTIERFVAMLEYQAEIVSGVRREQCLTLRRRWGKDKTSPGG